MKFNLNNPAFLQAGGNVNNASGLFFIESIEDSNEVSFIDTYVGINADKMEYSLDGKTWSKLAEETTIVLNRNERLYLKCMNDNIEQSSDNENEDLFVLWNVTKKYSVNGNITSLVYSSFVEMNDRAMWAYFANQENLVSAKKLQLPTTLAESCYGSMFNGCTSLTTAPELPATTLAESCYSGMFRGCTSLTTAPELPATTLAEYCYARMFYGCTSLTIAPELPVTTLAEYCYEYMFYGCTSLTIAPELPATTLTGSCYSSMFRGCTSLTTAPELPATTLAEYCYARMFNGCTSLSLVECLATDISATTQMGELPTVDWLTNVAASGTFIKSTDMEDWPTGASGIPTGWTVQDYVG